jgi:hypothetical protein
MTEADKIIATLLRKARNGAHKHQGKLAQTRVKQRVKTRTPEQRRAIAALDLAPMIQELLRKYAMELECIQAENIRLELICSVTQRAMQLADALEQWRFWVEDTEDE